jgi:hypothetical protein
MSREEHFYDNMALTRAHLLDVLANPQQYDWIPDGAYVVGLPQNDRRLFAANLKLANRLALKRDGHPIILLPEVAKRRNVRSKARAM